MIKNFLTVAIIVGYLFSSQVVASPENVDIFFIQPTQDDPANANFLSVYDLTTVTAPTLATGKEHFTLELGISHFYIGDLKDFGDNDGVLTISIKTDQSIKERLGIGGELKWIKTFTESDDSRVVGFNAKDVFKEVPIVKELVLRIDLYEQDGDKLQELNDIKNLIFDNKDPVISVANGNEYISIATGVFKFALRNYQKDDSKWETTDMSFDISPKEGFPFLRPGRWLIITDSDDEDYKVTTSDYNFDFKKMLWC